jgi:hypothetical protein
MVSLRGWYAHCLMTGMDVQTLLRLDADLKNFVDDIFVSLRRKEAASYCAPCG